MERLTPEDTAFLRLENRVAAMHSLSIAVVDGPAPDFEELGRRVADRLGFVPRLRQRVVEVPFGLERPVWVDSPQFNLEYHLRQTALPEPNQRSLDNLVSRVLSQRLDRGKPLWEMWAVSGLAGGQWAVLSKAHHAIIDGVSGLDPVAVVADEFVSEAVDAPGWAPDQMPSDRALITDALTDLATRPAEQARVVRRMARVPGDVASTVRRWSGVSDGPEGRGPHRRWASVGLPFEWVRARRGSNGQSSTNDVLLACVATGLRALAELGPPWSDPSASALVPFAVGPGGVFTNEVASHLVELPLGIDGFEETLAALGSKSLPRRAVRHQVPAAAMTNRRGLAAPTVAALGIRRVTRDGSQADTVAVNAPGPREPLTVLGQPVVSLASALPLATGVPIAFGILSYVDHFTVSVTTDLDTGIDPTTVTDAIGALIT